MSDLVAFNKARLDEDEGATYGAEDLWLIRDESERAVEARKLREVEAKRKILAEHAPDPVPWEASKWHGELTRCSQGHGDEYWTQWPCVEVRAVVAVWSDHPDFDPAWASDAS